MGSLLALDGTRHLNGATQQQQLFGDRGFAGIRVRDDCEGTPCVDGVAQVRHGFGLPLKSADYTPFLAGAQCKRCGTGNERLTGHFKRLSGVNKQAGAHRIDIEWNITETLRHGRNLQALVTTGVDT